MHLAPLLTCVLILPGLAHAQATPDQTPAPDATTTDAASAEHQRLSAEMARLAQRNAWEGVERSYQRILELGVDPSFDDLVLASEAARHRGDIAAARARLVTASARRDDPDVIASLAEIDESYGAVVLHREKGARGLAAEEPPFRPDRRAALAHATERVEQDGAFEGYLPEGAYTLGDREFEVAAGQAPLRVDAVDTAPPASQPVAGASPLARRFELRVGPGTVQQAETGVQDSFGLHAAASTALPAALRLAGAYHHRMQRQAYLSRNPDPTSGGPQRLAVDEQVIDARVGIEWDAASMLGFLPARTALRVGLAPRFVHFESTAFAVSSGSLRLSAEAAWGPTPDLTLRGGLGWGPHLFGTSETLALSGLPQHYWDAHAGVLLHLSDRPRWSLTGGWHLDSVVFKRSTRVRHLAMAGLALSL